MNAFYWLAQDRANKIVILTGAGADFVPGMDFPSFGKMSDPGVWSQVHHEGVQVLDNLVNIRVPVIVALFTEPELARIGLSETEAQAQGIAYRHLQASNGNQPACAQAFGDPRVC